jgi:release factor glutamine methyltransferase
MSLSIPTFQEILRVATRRLAEAGFESPRLDAEVLLRFLLDVDRTGLFLQLPDSAPTELSDALDELISRRLTGEPVAYIVGQREFMGLPFHVGPGVLVPRPETELLVEWALEWLERHPHASVFDVGTGSGAIALSIAALLPTNSAVKVLASDPSQDALTIARHNREALSGHGIVGKVQFLEQSLLDETTGPIDLVLANLPYLTPGQIAGNPDLEDEPRLALDGGKDGLDLVRALIGDLRRVLAPHGAAGFELDPVQTATVERLLAAEFPHGAVRTIDDLAGLSRHVVLSHEDG